MRYLWQFSIVIVVCFIITGCASRYVQPPRETITFDYVPKAEAPPGSADVTFAIVGTKFIAPTIHQQMMLLQQGVVLPSTSPPPLLFQKLVNNMTSDFEEVLTARGFTVRGSYRTLDEMIYPDKEGSDLILTAQVKFSADTSEIEYGANTPKFIGGCLLGTLGEGFFIAAGVTPKSSDQVALVILGTSSLIGTWIMNSNSPNFLPSGAVQIGCEIELEAYEGLTGEIMWTKRIPVPSFTVVPKAGLSENPGPVTWQQLMKIDNKFYSDIGRVLEMQYDKILNQIYTYLDPREMAIVKNQAMELRERKVF